MFVSFFGWLGICLLLQAASYYHNYTFKDHLPRQSTVERFSQAEIDQRGSLFDETDGGGHSAENRDFHLNIVTEDSEGYEDEDGDRLGEPLVVGRRAVFNKRSMDDANMSYFYQTGESKY